MTCLCHKSPSTASTLQQIFSKGRVEELVAPGLGGGTGGDRDSTHGLGGLPCPGHIPQIPGASSRDRGRQLASSGPQPRES